MCSVEEDPISVRRHVPHLSRQMEQDEVQPTCIIIDSHSELLTSPSDKVSCAPPDASTIHDLQAQIMMNSQTAQHKLPPTQVSQGSNSSSSNTSGRTRMSISTSESGSGKSSRCVPKRMLVSRTVRQSSSASSSTEETEARERRFGSVDLHPLPIVTGRGSLITGTTIRTATQYELHQLAMLTLQQQCSAMILRLGTPDCFQPNKSSSPDQLEQAALLGRSVGLVIGLSPASPVTPLFSDNQPIGANHPLHPLNLLPSALWPCLICPSHSQTVLHTFRLLVQQINQTDCSGKWDELPNTKPQLSSSGTDLHHQSSSSNEDRCHTSPNPANTNGLVSPRIGPYEMGITLGRGNFAVVKLAKHVHTKVKVAVKIMNKELIGSSNLNKVSRELEAMKRCQHPYIVRLYHVMESESNIFMVTEYASKGEIFDHISKSRAFHEKEARELFWQIVCAIDFCHQSGVVHRDLKAENLLLDSELKIKVADFGFCNFFQPNQLLSTHCGSPQYAAPELFKGEPYDGPAADVWSLGVILYILVCGSFPFPGESLGDIRSQVLRGLVRFPFYLSTACEHVIRSMLQIDPSRRLKLRQIINTPWMQASPNLEHYRSLVYKYEEKAKNRQFDEIFRRQYPDHSELAKVDQIKLEERQLDVGSIRALFIGAGYDEAQIRLSTLQNKCDRFHAAYELLKAKIDRFRRDPHLSLLVTKVFQQANRSKTGRFNNTNSGPARQRSDSVRRASQFAVVPDVIHEAMSDEGEEVYSGEEPISTEVCMTSVDESSVKSAGVSESQEDDEHPIRSRPWMDPVHPGSVSLNVALFILKADEEYILTQLSQSDSSTDSALVSSNLRRHTIQLTEGCLHTHLPPMTNPNHYSGLFDQKTVTSGTVQPISDSDNDPSSVQTAHQQDSPTTYPVSATHRFPRQTTQPHIDELSQYKSGQKQERLIRTTLDWISNAWGRVSTTNSTNARPSGVKGLNIPSLELGQEASTTEIPPDLVRHHPGLQRGHEFDDDEEASITQMLRDYAENDLEFTNLSLSAQPSDPVQSGAFWSNANVDAVQPIRDGSSPFEVASRSEKTTTMYTDPHDRADLIREETVMVSEGRSEQLPDQESVASDDSHDLDTLLPQLNLPANLPPMMHQPMARFTVKDPHLLAPPEYMTPQSSSFPRRSSDGAAELQPLHRPTFIVGGSYPEQSNYRNLHTGSVTGPPNTKSNDPDHITPISTVELHANQLQSSSANENPTNSSPTSSLPRPTIGRQKRSHSTWSAKSRRAFNILNMTGQSNSGLLPWWKPSNVDGRLGNTETDADGSGGGNRVVSLDRNSQIDRHRKRFSLPIGYRPTTVFEGNRSANCLCHHQPVTSEMLEQIHQQIHNIVVSANKAESGGASPVSAFESKLDATFNSVDLALRRGSEASQLMSWEQRLHQFGDSCSPTDTQALPTPFVVPPLSASTEPLTRPESELNPQLSVLSHLGDYPHPVHGNLTARDLLQLAAQPRHCQSRTRPYDGIQLNELQSELHKLEAANMIQFDPARSDRLSSTAISPSDIAKNPVFFNPQDTPDPSAVDGNSLVDTTAILYGCPTPHSSPIPPHMHFYHDASLVPDGLSQIMPNASMDQSSIFLNPMAQASSYMPNPMIQDSSDLDSGLSNSRSPGSASLTGTVGIPRTSFSSERPRSSVELKSSSLSSSGVKRRLMSNTGHFKQPQDYLRNFGGSLDRRINVDFLNSPKRKLYQDWLPKFTAFSRRAAASVLRAVNPPTEDAGDNCDLNVSVDSECVEMNSCLKSELVGYQSLSTTGSPLLHPASFISHMEQGRDSGLADSTRYSDADQPAEDDDLEGDDDDEGNEEEEEERACQIAPLQSQSPWTRPLLNNFESVSSNFQNPYLSHMVVHPTPSEFNPKSMFLQTDDDDEDDLVEIDRVNQRFSLTGGLSSQIFPGYPTVTYPPLFPGNPPNLQFPFGQTPPT